MSMAIELIHTNLQDVASDDHTQWLDTFYSENEFANALENLPLLLSPQEITMMQFGMHVLFGECDDGAQYIAPGVPFIMHEHGVYIDALTDELHLVTQGVVYTAPPGRDAGLAVDPRFLNVARICDATHVGMKVFDLQSTETLAEVMCILKCLLPTSPLIQEIESYWWRKQAYDAMPRVDIGKKSSPEIEEHNRELDDEIHLRRKKAVQRYHIPDVQRIRNKQMKRFAIRCGTLTTEELVFKYPGFLRGGTLAGVFLPVQNRKKAKR